MRRSQQGSMLAIAAFTLWGAFPFYFKLVSHFTPLEILANRIIWSLLALALLLICIRQWHKVRSVFIHKQYLALLTFATVLIATNWAVYIWSVTSSQLFEASLGYYINPLVNVFLGFTLLQERLRGLQWLAVILAALGVLIQIVNLGELPWIALVLAFSFSLYGLIHKRIEVEAIPGLLVETMLLFPIAIGYLAVLMFQQVGPQQWDQADWLLLSVSGPVTIIPLILFTAAAQRIAYTSIGFIQYITPSLLFLLAGWFYHEPYDELTLLTFGFIWLALLLFSLDAIHHRKSIGNR